MPPKKRFQFGTTMDPAIASKLKIAAKEDGYTLKWVLECLCRFWLAWRAAKKTGKVIDFSQERFKEKDSENIIYEIETPHFKVAEPKKKYPDR